MSNLDQASVLLFGHGGLLISSVMHVQTKAPGVLIQRLNTPLPIGDAPEDNEYDIDPTSEPIVLCFENLKGLEVLEQGLAAMRLILEKEES